MLDYAESFNVCQRKVQLVKKKKKLYWLYYISSVFSADLTLILAVHHFKSLSQLKSVKIPM